MVSYRIGRSDEIGAYGESGIVGSYLLLRARLDLVLSLTTDTKRVVLSFDSLLKICGFKEVSFELFKSF